MRTVAFALFHTSTWIGLTAWVLARPATPLIQLVTGALAVALTAAAAYTGSVVVLADRERPHRYALEDALDVGPLALLVIVSFGTVSTGTPRVVAAALGVVVLGMTCLVGYRLATSAHAARLQRSYLPPRPWVLATALRSLSGQERTGIGWIVGAAGALGLAATALQLLSLVGAWIAVEVILPALTFLANAPRRGTRRLLSGRSLPPIAYGMADALASLAPAAMLWVAWRLCRG